MEVQVIKESGAIAGNEPRPFFDFLEGCLRHKVQPCSGPQQAHPCLAAVLGPSLKWPGEAQLASGQMLCPEQMW